MKPTARSVARHVLRRVAEGGYATLSLSGELERADLPPKDRALCTELVYGVLRHRLRLDHALTACASSPRGIARLDPRVLDALRLSAYQILLLRTPAHAAVDDAVGYIKQVRGPALSGFANALLRRLSQAGEPPLPADPAQALSIATSTPPWLVEDALRRFGADEGARFLQAQAQAPPVWLRCNRLRGPIEAALQALLQEVPAGSLTQSGRLPEAVRLGSVGGAVFHGAAYGAGWFTAQDLGAQLVARLLVSPSTIQPAGAPVPDGPVLDACAGVGGKSTHLSALFEGARDIDAADQSERKLELLQDHVHRLGCPRVRPVLCDLTNTGADGAARLRPMYAAILLDAPCSGLGVLRRHPEARYRVTRDNVRDLAALQRRLLVALCQRVQPGGALVYSVCTYTDEEGPQQIAAFLADHPEFQVDPPRDTPGGPALADLTDASGALRTWPHRDDADAFYAVRLRRRPS